MPAPALPSKLLSATLTPFLYPCLDSTWLSSSRSCLVLSSRKSTLPRALCRSKRTLHTTSCKRQAAEASPTSSTSSSTSIAHDAPPAVQRPEIDVSKYDHLTPVAPDYTTQPFTDSCDLTLTSGSGGHGCISFLREKFIANGPPNGGDGGTGGNVYIQAVRGETSLHKLSRRSILKAGRGKNGEGGMRGGRRGQDILVTVPVGTVVREVGRYDPMEQEEEEWNRGFGFDIRSERKPEYDSNSSRDRNASEYSSPPSQAHKWRRDKWLLYPGSLPSSFSSADFPALPRPRRSQLAAQQPPAPLYLDLSTPMDTPMLLAAGASGGLGNAHFVTKSVTRPKYGTKGDAGIELKLQLELKLLADVGLVGLPNAGKSTLLRALTRSRTRVGSWAFTTLAPSIGTVVLDDHLGRSWAVYRQQQKGVDGKSKEYRTNFTIADIPGLIEDAHLDRGLGLGFLRHVERAAVLAFVVDLSAGVSVPDEGEDGATKVTETKPKPDASGRSEAEAEAGSGTDSAAIPEAPAVAALKALWREVSEYETRRELEIAAETQRSGGPDAEGLIGFKPFRSAFSPGFDPEVDSDLGGEAGANASSSSRDGEQEQLMLDPEKNRPLPPLSLPPISSKPWFVVATKADLPGTRENFLQLRKYLEDVQSGAAQPPCGRKNAWRRRLQTVPVSAINKEGVEGIPELVLGLLDG